MGLKVCFFCKLFLNESVLFSAWHFLPREVFSNEEKNFHKMSHESSCQHELMLNSTKNEHC